MRSGESEMMRLASEALARETVVVWSRLAGESESSSPSGPAHHPHSVAQIDVVGIVVSW
jgi:hypothetical protein